MVIKALKKYVPKVGGGASIRTDTGKYMDVMITAIGRVYADVHYVGKKEVFTVERKELESPLFPDVNTRFAYFERLAYYTMIRKTKALLVVGKSGLGKSYSVEQIIDREGLTEGDDFIYIKGYSSAKALYDTLCEYKDDVLVIDDCDSVFTDKIAVNIIKAALDVFAKRRIVSWRTGGTQGGKVKSFEFTGSVLFISNLPIEDIAAAIISRTKIVDLFMTVPETIERMRFLLPYLSAGADKPLSTEHKELVLDLLDKYQYNINDFNVRTLLKAFETFFLYLPEGAEVALEATKFQVIQG